MCKKNGEVTIVGEVDEDFSNMNILGNDCSELVVFKTRKPKKFEDIKVIRKKTVFNNKKEIINNFKLSKINKLVKRKNLPKWYVVLLEPYLIEFLVDTLHIKNLRISFNNGLEIYVKDKKLRRLCKRVLRGYARVVSYIPKSKSQLSCINGRVVIGNETQDVFKREYPISNRLDIKSRTAYFGSRIK